MISVSWIECGECGSDGHYGDLERLDMKTITATTGVYVIWHEGNPARVVRIGQGNMTVSRHLRRSAGRRLDLDVAHQGLAGQVRDDMLAMMERDDLATPGVLTGGLCACDRGLRGWNLLAYGVGPAIARPSARGLSQVALLRCSSGRTIILYEKSILTRRCRRQRPSTRTRRSAVNALTFSRRSGRGYESGAPAVPQN